MADRLLEVNDLATYFFTADGVVKAVDGISYHIDEQESGRHRGASRAPERA